MIQIYDSYSKKYKEVNSKSINIYVCGITTSDYCHLGHAFSSVSFEILDIDTDPYIYVNRLFSDLKYQDSKVPNLSIKRNDPACIIYTCLLYTSDAADE